jgi:hypothetical protein
VKTKFVYTLIATILIGAISHAQPVTFGPRKAPQGAKVSFPIGGGPVKFDVVGFGQAISDFRASHQQDETVQVDRNFEADDKAKKRKLKRRDVWLSPTDFSDSDEEKQRTPPNYGDPLVAAAFSNTPASAGVALTNKQIFPGGSRTIVTQPTQQTSAAATNATK